MTRNLHEYPKRATNLLNNNPPVKQADQFVIYFQRLADGENGARWLLGLYMAKQWVRLLEEAHSDFEELNLFVKVLEAEKPNQGSGWAELLCHAQAWVAEIEHV